MPSRGFGCIFRRWNHADVERSSLCFRFGRGCVLGCYDNDGSIVLIASC